MAKVPLGAPRRDFLLSQALQGVVVVAPVGRDADPRARKRPDPGSVRRIGAAAGRKSSRRRWCLGDLPKTGGLGHRVELQRLTLCIHAPTVGTREAATPTPRGGSGGSRYGIRLSVSDARITVGTDI